MPASDGKLFLPVVFLVDFLDSLKADLKNAKLPETPMLAHLFDHELECFKEICVWLQPHYTHSRLCSAVLAKAIATLVALRLHVCNDAGLEDISWQNFQALDLQNDKGKPFSAYPPSQVERKIYEVISTVQFCNGLANVKASLGWEVLLAPAVDLIRDLVPEMERGLKGN